MKYTNYKVMLFDSYTKRFESISSCNSRKEAEEWINLYDPNNTKSLKIVTEKRDFRNFSKKEQDYIKQKITEASSN